MIRWLVGTWLATVVGGGSCRSDSARALVSGADCSSTVLCPAGLVCREGACLGTGGHEGPVHLRIRPGPDRSLAAVELPGLVVDGPVVDLEQVQVPFQVALDGQVLDPEGRSVAATRVVGLPRGGLAEEALAVEGRASAVNPAIFSVAIAPWWPTSTGMRSLTAYELRIALPGLPPWGAELRWNQVEPRIVVEIPRTDSVIRLPGVVRVGGANRLPLADVRVVAMGPGGPLSSESLTDALGRFELLFWPSGEARSVMLHVTATDPSRPLPTLEVPAEVPAVGTGQRVELEVGDPERLFEASLRVEGDEGPLAGTDVKIAVEAGGGTYTAAGRTDAQGRVRLTTYPGVHRVDVVASLNDPTRVTRVERTLTVAQPEATVSPRLRTPVAGRVVDSAGSGVPGAVVEAFLLQPTFGDPTLGRPGDAVPSRHFRTEALEDGSFVLSLDPGSHLLVVRPGRGLPLVYQEIAFSGEQPRTLEPTPVPPAAVVRARLVDEDGAVLPETRVEAWSAGPAPRRLAVTHTDASGRFRLRIPGTP